MNKPTEKGLVPELRFPEFREQGEWAAKQLSELCALQAGKFVRAAEIKESNVDGLYPCYGGNGLRGFTVTFTHEGKYSLIGRQGALCGNINFVTKKFHATEHAVVVTPKEKINNSWLYYELVRLDLNRFATGQAQPGLSVDNLLKVISSAPKIEKEQQKIADCLSSLDELVSANSQKLDALKAHKKGLMQQLFPAEGETAPKLRFPEFENQTSWKKRSFSKLFEIGGGKDHKHLPSGNIPVYGSGGYMRSVNEFLYDGESACIGRKGTINKPMFLTGKFWTVDTLFYTHSFNGCTAKFIYLLFQNIDWLSLNEAGGVPSLSKVIINKIEVMIPEIKEQHRITDCIDSLEEVITAQSQKIEALKTHKRGLMQQLFPILIGEANAT